MREDLIASLTRPIINQEYRTPLETFDIMCDRIRAALRQPAGVKVKALEWVEAKALGNTRKLIALDCFRNEFARLDLPKTGDEIALFKERSQKRYEACILSALSAAEAENAGRPAVLNEKALEAGAVTFYDQNNCPVCHGIPDYFGSLVDRARDAAEKASTKFPQPNYVTLKIAEEAGEVVRGAVHYAENRMEWKEVEGEIVQLLAMLIRFVTEGDQINGITPPAAAEAENARLRKLIEEKGKEPAAPQKAVTWQGADRP